MGHTKAEYHATVSEIAEVAAGLPENRREGNISDNIVGTTWPNTKDGILVALTSMNVNPGEFVDADDIKYVLDEGNSVYYDNEPLWAVLDLAVRCGMIEECLREAAEIAKDLTLCAYADCTEGNPVIRDDDDPDPRQVTCSHCRSDLGLPPLNAEKENE